MNLIIFGPQASGKGTQADMIAESFGMAHISTGDIFRDNISRGTELGKIAESLINYGKYVSDEITNKIIEARLKEDDCKNGFILDGYPRTKSQVEFLENLPYNIDMVINIEVSREEIIKRLSTRRICSNCKANYNTITIPPKEEGICDKCGGKLGMRDDDTPDAIKKRLAQHHELTEPLLEFYKKKGIVKTINGERPIDEVFKSIKEILN